jgi:hypothetical protein
MNMEHLHYVHPADMQVYQVNVGRCLHLVNLHVYRTCVMSVFHVQGELCMLEKYNQIHVSIKYLHHLFTVLFIHSIIYSLYYSHVSLSPPTESDMELTSDQRV